MLLLLRMCYYCVIDVLLEHTATNVLLLLLRCIELMKRILKLTATRAACGPQMDDDEDEDEDKHAVI